MNEDTKAFHLEEYKQVRAEVVGLLAKIDQFFRFSVLVPTAVYSWLLVNAVGVHNVTIESKTIATLCLKVSLPIQWIAWMIPPVFVLFCGLMSIAFAVRVSQFGTYLERLENGLGDSRLGWEKFNGPLAPRLKWVHTIVWLALFATCIGSTFAGLYLARHNPELCVSK